MPLAFRFLKVALHRSPTASALMIAAMAFFAPASGAQAAASGWIENEGSRLRLIAAVNAVVQNQLLLGVEFELEPGWKTYWRDPGDAGLPLSIDWAGSQNLAAADLRWPAPERHPILGVESIGYEDHVVFPVAARVIDAGRDLVLEARVDYLACGVLCVPQSERLTLHLPAGPAQDAIEAAILNTFLVRVPSASDTGFGIELTGAEPTVEGATLILAVSSDRPLVRPDVFVETPSNLSAGSPVISVTKGGHRAIAKVALVADDGAPLSDGVIDLAGQQIRVTAADGVRAVERIMVLPTSLPLVVEAADGAQPATVTWGELTIILGLAFAGGFILNFMPCVLPVLSIKLLTILRQGGLPRRNIRASFLASTAGIFVAFLVVALAAAGMKWAGLQLGWGMQFQHPLFLAIVLLTVTLFALNLLGLFDVVLPRALASLSAVRMPGGHDGLAGSFAGGVLASLLAMPCSAPFLGTALGFALGRGVAEIFLVFALLALGFSLPFLLVAAFPALVAWLPRPGAWMLVLRRGLGRLLLLTAVWLFYLVWQLAGTGPALLNALALLAVAALLFVMRDGKRREGTFLVASFAVFSLVGPALVEAGHWPGMSAADQAEGPRPFREAEGVETKTDWQPFRRSEVSELVGAGEIVLVDVAAEWCITCLVNKRSVLESDAVIAALSDHKVHLWRADWTRPDLEIADYLASFGRYGIPFNVVYGPDAPDGIVLPEILTRDSVLRAIAIAGKENMDASRL